MIHLNQYGVLLLLKYKYTNIYICIIYLPKIRRYTISCCVALQQEGKRPDETPARQQTHRHETNKQTWGKETLWSGFYLVGYIGLSRLFLASYNKARDHDETPARQQSHRHEVMRPKLTDLQSQKVIVVVSRAEQKG